MWSTSTVRCGDCCAPSGFIRNEAAKVVVDLGKRSSAAGVRAAEFNPHILILTHSDDDHIGGFEALASAWPDGLCEVWVPYEWSLLAEARAALSGWDRPDAEREVQPDQIRVLGVSGEPISLPTAALVKADADDQVLESPAELTLMRQRQQLVVEVDGLSGSDALEGAITKIIDEEREANPSWPPVPNPAKAQHVAKDVIKKSGAISRILDTAVLHGVRVRYFSTDAIRFDRCEPWTSEGLTGFATIVNAVEVYLLPASFRDPARALYLAYQLTVQNRRALAVFLWARGCLCGVERIRAILGLDRATDIPMKIWDAPLGKWYVKPWGALIWSDGAGESCQVGWAGGVQNDLVPWEHIAVMSAPHHGSKGKGHREIWAALVEAERVLDRKIAVFLAGGSGSQGTSEQYLDTHRTMRACTRCRHLKEKSSKTVVLVVDGPAVTISPICRS